MIPDNSGIDYARMLLFVFGFLVYFKIAKILAPSLAAGNTWFTTWLQIGHLNAVKKNVTWEKTVLRFYLNKYLHCFSI